MLICATAVALLFHTYLPPESYELFVKEFSIKYNITIGKMKTLYDCCSCILSIALSLIFFGTFVGVKWGTIICALVNGWLISSVGKVLEEKFYFKDAFPLRKKIM